MAGKIILPYQKKKDNYFENSVMKNQDPKLSKYSY